MKNFFKVRWPLYVLGIVLAIAGVVIAWNKGNLYVGSVLAVAGLLLIKWSGDIVRIGQGMSLIDWLKSKFGA